MKIKKIICVLAVVILACCCLVACGEKTVEHVHTFSEDWSYDVNSHWHSATCGHDEQKSGLGDHVWSEGEVTVNATCYSKGSKVYSCSGCTAKIEEEIPKTAHSYSSGKIAYKLLDKNVFTVDLCDYCGEETNLKLVYGALIASDTASAQRAINRSKSGDTIFLKAGTYGALEFMSHKGDDFGNISIVGEDNVTVKAITLNVHQDYAPDNLLIRNINFVGGPDFGGVSSYIEINNLTVKDCSFSGHANLSVATNFANNLVVDNCTFTNVESSNSSLTAIYVQKVNGITVKNCYFDGVQYNALQVGSSELKGAVSITGNTFKNVNSRVIYMLKTAGVTSCNISNNKFYSKETTLNKSDGNYVKTGEGNVVVGVNYWETIPEADELYFTEGVTYLPSEQKQL